jgi:hypothetical protein
MKRALVCSIWAVVFATVVVTVLEPAGHSPEHVFANVGCFAFFLAIAFYSESVRRSSDGAR